MSCLWSLPEVGGGGPEVGHLGFPLWLSWGRALVLS